METFAERFKSLRGKLTQEQFSDLLDIAQKDVSKYESGKVLPDTQRLLKIQEKLNVSLDWLLKGIGEKEFLVKSGVSDYQLRQAALEVIESVKEKFLDNYKVPGKDEKSKKKHNIPLNNYRYSLN